MERSLKKDGESSTTQEENGSPTPKQEGESGTTHNGRGRKPAPPKSEKEGGKHHPEGEGAWTSAVLGLASVYVGPFLAPPTLRLLARSKLCSGLGRLGPCRRSVWPCVGSPSLCLSCPFSRSFLWRCCSPFLSDGKNITGLTSVLTFSNVPTQGLGIHKQEGQFTTEFQRMHSREEEREVTIQRG